MKHTMNLLAFDLGSSNGRGILGHFDGTSISMKEVHRFPNSYIEMGGMVYWDVLHIYANMKQAFQQCRLSAGELAAFGIDAWGNDYGLVDKNGQLLANARSARHTTQEDVERVHRIVPGRELFRRTGNASYSINTLYQVCRRVHEGDPAIENARALLMIPDLLAFFFTGELHSEYTISTTTMMYHQTNRDWDWELLDRLNIPRRICQPVLPAGTLSGSLKGSLAEETGVGRVAYAAVGSHDTASACAAVPALPGEEDYAFCSTGTWSLFGVEAEQPIFLDDMYDNAISNEGTVQGGVRCLKNIVGLWIIQECKKQWKRQGMDLSYDEIDAAAREAPPLRSYIDPDDSAFFGVSSMVDSVKGYCRETGQPIPETVGEVARSIYEGLAIKYRWTMDFLEGLRGRPLRHLYLVGGGIQSELMNEFTADCVGRPVTAGPQEAACMGNLLTQAMALGEIHGLAQLREVVRNSSPIRTYEPHPSSAWEEACANMENIIRRRRQK